MDRVRKYSLTLGHQWLLLTNYYSLGQKVTNDYSLQTITHFWRCCKLSFNPRSVTCSEQKPFTCIKS